MARLCKYPENYVQDLYFSMQFTVYIHTHEIYFTQKIQVCIFQYASDKNVECFNNIYFQEFGHQETAASDNKQRIRGKHHVV